MNRRVFLGAAAGLAAAGAYVGWRKLRGPESLWAKGMQVDAIDGVAVYDNGPIFMNSHGRHYADDGYYFGQKWQCVEFVKRYLYSAKGHRLPDVMGHAISFFDPSVPHRGVNAKRGMVQFADGGDERPQAGDLIVFGGAGGYGHVAIVVNAGHDFLLVIQQNKAPVRETLRLFPSATGGVMVGESSIPALGWLRVAAQG